MNSFLMLKNSKGFTLVELLLVVALMAISFGVTSDILVTLMRSFNKTTVITEIEQQAGVVSQMIEKEIRNAAVVTNPGGDANIIQFEDTLGNIARYHFQVYNSIGTLYRYPYPTVPDMDTLARRRTYAITGNPGLTAGLVGGVNVTCSGPCFTVNVGRPSVVQVNFVFSQAQANPNSSYSGRIEIHNTIVVRNTY
ncbi:prepilin-type N-terminal cleavage/methylation domain-containing protein [candidate division WWE3 bacterium]|uniref:Prepilin-type N-terminal cleavage/methylation domain-containing protein n=1 Tax=candidate division WWE3 bacterium TaxID=2053526 RepID=A0A7X9DKW3_UNCKA|nr:prepilin-type N-terminal cleavage/methylation domain-containing protein [candidate division WWE3 bacterium]